MNGATNLVWPVMACSKTSCAGQSIQWRQLQWRRIHQHKVPSTIGIDLIKAIEDTIYIIGNYGLIETAVCQECIVSKVIGANPHRVHGVVALAVCVQRICVRTGIDVLAVRDERIDFIHDVWEWSENCCKVAVDHVVVADCSGDSVVVEHGTGVV